MLMLFASLASLLNSSSPHQFRLIQRPQASTVHLTRDARSTSQHSDIHIMRAYILILALLSFIALIAAPVLSAASASSEVSVDASASNTAPGLYTIEGQVRLPRAGSKFVNARVLLNGGESVGVIRADGSFQLHNVLAGRSYTIDVSMPEYQFATVRVDISNKVGQKGKMKASLASTKAKLAYPLVLKPTIKTEYFQKREPVNFFGMLKNPMVIMMGITLLMVVVMVSCECNLRDRIANFEIRSAIADDLCVFCLCSLV